MGEGLVWAALVFGEIEGERDNRVKLKSADGGLLLFRMFLHCSCTNIPFTVLSLCILMVFN